MVPECGGPVGSQQHGLAPGAKLGRYEVVKSLDKGGMGEVYLARDLSLGREVAIVELQHNQASEGLSLSQRAG
jgi:serine/threonine protein kinase